MRPVLLQRRDGELAFRLLSVFLALLGAASLPLGLVVTVIGGIAGLALGYWQAWLFVAAMLAGMLAHRFIIAR